MNISGDVIVCRIVHLAYARLLPFSQSGANGSAILTSETTDAPDNLARATTSPSLQTSATVTHRQSLDTETAFDWFDITVPIICLVGIVGNILNVIVLTRRRMLSSLDRLGVSAYHGLVTLAVSDLLFCVTVFPHTFVKQVVATSTHEQLFGMYYKIYGIGLINLFLMTSTWMVTITSMTRYFAILRPLQARAHARISVTPLVVSSIFVSSLVLSLPYFLHVGVRPCWTPSGTMYEYYQVLPDRATVALLQYLRWVWPVLADFIPIVVLIFCNVALIRQLRNAASLRRRQCPGQVIKGTNKRITVTLISVVLMQLLLVSPSEVLKYVNPYRSWGRVGFIVASITNLMQAMNFASNFLLYLVVNVNFRQTMKTMVTEKWRCWRASRSYRVPADSQSIYATASYKSLRKLLQASAASSDRNRTTLHANQMNQ